MTPPHHMIDKHDLIVVCAIFGVASLLTVLVLIGVL